MNPEKLQSVYFLGAGGIGVSALARYFQVRGVKVCGYDRSPSRLTGELIMEGIPIHFQEDISLIPSDIQLVIYTPAIPSDNQEWIHLKNLGIPMVKRAEALGMIAGSHQTLAVAGTHGKTSTSSIAAQILHSSAQGCTAFLGGISKNHNSNLLLSDTSPWLVTEADEFDRSFLHLHPRMAVITAIDADHLDIYLTFGNLLNAYRDFAAQVQSEGLLIVKQGLEHLLTGYCHCPLLTYSLSDSGADYYASDIKVTGDSYTYTLWCRETRIEEVRMNVPALMNIENSVAAAALAFEAGCTPEEIRKGIGSFKGIRRRFEKIHSHHDFHVYDDYAHHPEEITALAQSLRHLYPDCKITAIFQPHLYSRTRDFADGFASSLQLFDEVYLLDIYPARELPLRGVDSGMIARKMTPHPRIVTQEEAFNLITSRQQGVMVTVGAGDIEKLALLAEQYFIQHT